MSDLKEHLLKYIETRREAAYEHLDTLDEYNPVRNEEHAIIDTLYLIERFINDFDKD